MPVIQPMMIENNQGGGGGKDPNWNFNSNKGQQGHYAPFKKMMFKNTDLSEKMKSRELLLKNLPTLRSDSSQNQDTQHEHVYEQDKPNQ
ncbi:MAG: hypothetical protein NXI03_12295, partial [Alphaproteobacteria bacterium]|nr:hypothetical protein [Alphaproteobacteria bacterium]